MDDEERDDVMSLDMTDRVMGYQSFQGASTSANTSSKGRKVLGSSRHSRPHHSVCQLLALVGFKVWLPHPCHSAAAVHAPTACVCERNWSDVHQALLKACFGTRAKLIYICCDSKTYLWPTWSPVCSSLPNKMKRVPRIEQLG